MNSKKNIHQRIEQEINKDLLKPEMDILTKNTGFSEADEIKIRDWFPIYYNGYYALIGYKLSDNNFFMSEPIVIVYTNRRYVRSIRQYYKLKGDYSLKTYEMFDINLNDEYIGGLSTICGELFKNGLSENWVKDIYQVNQFISDFYVKNENLWLSNINEKLGEILDPRANYYLFKSCNVIDVVKKLVETSFQLIKAGRPWRYYFIKCLQTNGWNHLARKLRLIHKPIPRLSMRVDRRTMQWIYLWTPCRQKDGKFAIQGRVYDQFGELVDFSSEIRFVDADGVTIETALGFYQLMGPICGLPFERDFNFSIVNFVMRKLILQFSYGFPVEWRDLLTIIDTVLATGICSWSPSM